MSPRPVKKSPAASYTVHQGGGRRMDAYDWSTGIYAAAVAMAQACRTGRAVPIANPLARERGAAA